MNRTWLKLAAPARVGAASVKVEQSVSDWNIGDRVIITTGDAQGPESGHTFRSGVRGRQKSVGTEERVITAIAGEVLTLDRPLAKAHHGEGLIRCEVANLSRNVVIESADPAGLRGLWTRKTNYPVSYYFHDTPAPGTVTRVASVNTPQAMQHGDYRSIDGWTGQEARAAEVKPIAFPQLLTPVDDLPPATLITSIQPVGARQIVRGISHDNGEIAAISVNGRKAAITTQHAGVADWSITLDTPSDRRYLAKATDGAGNAELMPHDLIHLTQ